MKTHISTGRGSLFGMQGVAGLVGLQFLEAVFAETALADSLPVVTSGDASLASLADNTCFKAGKLKGVATSRNEAICQVVGVNAYSFAAGTFQVNGKKDVATSLMLGHIGAEVGLIFEANERAGTQSFGGSDHLSGHAVMFAMANDSLIGEDYFAVGAFLQPGTALAYSLRVQDILRWALVFIILGGICWRLLG
jgi:hypothetical protein